MMRRNAAAIPGGFAVAGLALVLSFALTACDNNAHDGEHCIRTHVETIVVPVGGGYCGKGCYMPPVMVPSTRTVCDQWAPDDPATVKP